VTDAIKEKNVASSMLALTAATNAGFSRRTVRSADAASAWAARRE